MKIPSKAAVKLYLYFKFAGIANANDDDFTASDFK
jgi:hypothetical protein